MFITFTTYLNRKSPNQCMNCELCGKPATERAIIEGATLTVCAKCVQFGNRLAPPAVKQTISYAKPAEPVLTVVTNVHTLVRQAREKSGVSQKDFALKLNEHQSVIHHIEIGKPVSIELARKLEKALRLTLVEESTPVQVTNEKTKNVAMTIGDMIKIKGG